MLHVHSSGFGDLFACFFSFTDHVSASLFVGLLDSCTSTSTARPHFRCWAFETFPQTMQPLHMDKIHPVKTTLALL